MTPIIANNLMSAGVILAERKQGFKAFFRRFQDAG